jgi:hypothetical protein
MSDPNAIMKQKVVHYKKYIHYSQCVSTNGGCMMNLENSNLRTKSVTVVVYLYCRFFSGERSPKHIFLRFVDPRSSFLPHFMSPPSIVTSLI